MKKLLIFILLITMIPGAVVFGAFDVVEADYEYTINNDHWFNLSTGVYEYNVDYNTTNRIAIKYDSINLDNFLSFHHLLFFKNNEYLGYYNSQITTYIVPETFLGVLNTFTPAIPTGATHFVVVDYNNYKNLVPKEELNNHTLRDVFELGNIIENPTFNNTTGWTSSTATITSENGYLKVTPFVGLDTPEAISQNYTVTNGHLFYLRGYYYVDNPNTILVFVRLYNGSPISLSLSSFTRYQWGTIKGEFTSTSNSISFGLRNTFTSSLTTDLFRWDSFYVINKTTLGISSLTVQQMDSYFELYISNLASDVYYQHYRNLTNNPPLISYIYEKPIPDDTPPLDKIDNFLDDLGIGSKGFKLFISIAVIAITMILLVIVFNAPTLLIVMSAVLEVVLFVFMKWIPNYVIIVLAVIVFILIVKEKGGKNEE